MCITIYHNTRWGKSRKTLQLLRDNGFEPNIIEYLKNPPNVNELKKICKILDLSAIDIIRTNENEYKQSNISMDDTDDVIIEKIIRHPRLLERPIVIMGNNGIIGRPPENVLKLLKSPIWTNI